MAASNPDKTSNPEKKAPKAPSDRSIAELLALDARRAATVRAALKDGPVALIDLGSSKAVAAVLTRDEARPLGSADDGLRLNGLGVFRARGVRAGAVEEIASAAQAVRGALNQAERDAGMTASVAVASISAGYPRSHVVSGEAPLAGLRCVDDDLAKAAAACRAPAEMAGRTLLHAIPAGWSLDGDVIRDDPRGLAGRRLGLDLHLLTAADAAVANLAHSLARADLDLLAPVASPLAAGLAALSADEREDGAAVLDLGAGVSGVGLFLRGRLVFADALRVGGEQATLDVARLLGVDRAEAERLKTLEGSVVDLGGAETLRLSDAASYGERRRPTRADLTAILRPRFEETLELARDRLAQAGFNYLPTPRLVLAGGGAEMAGALELARRVFGRTVRLARPIPAPGGDPAQAGPAFATLHGLAAYVGGVEAPSWGKAVVKKSRGKGAFGGLMQWLRDTW